MKKTLIAVALLSLVAANAEAHGGGWHGGYYGYHGYYGASNFWWGAAFGAALTLPFYYAYSRPDPAPYYYSAPPVVYANPPVYVQSQPVYVQSQPVYAVAAQPRTRRSPIAFQQWRSRIGAGQRQQPAPGCHGQSA